MHDAARELAAYERLVGLYLDSGDMASARDLYGEAEALGLGEQLPVALRMRLALFVSKHGDLLRAETIYASICRGGVVDEPTAEAAIAAADLALAAGRKGAARMLYQKVQEGAPSRRRKRPSRRERRWRSSTGRGGGGGTGIELA